KVEAGITLSELSRALWERGLAMESLGDIDRQTLAGAISTATHGTGSSFRNLSAQVEAFELVLADGSGVEVSGAADRDAYLADREARPQLQDLRLRAPGPLHRDGIRDPARARPRGGAQGPGPGARAAPPGRISDRVQGRGGR